MNSPETAFNEHTYESADGLQLYYRSFGAGSFAKPGGLDAAHTVLCLPGLTRNSRDFESLAAYLADHYRVLTPDLRGRGRSAYDPNWANYQPARYVEDAFRLLDVEQVQRCAIIGTSLGGLMGIFMGAQQPARIAGLVLNDIGPDLDPRGIERIRAVAGKLPPVRTWDEATAQAKLINGHAFPDLPDEEWRAFAQRTYRETPDGVLHRDLDPNIARAFGDATAAAPNLWPYFELLRGIPMLVLRGAHSDLFAPETLARMQKVKPDLRALVVANRGHAPSLAEPEARAAIDEFLATLW